MHGRRGFFLIWANLAVCIVLLLVGAAALALQSALRYDILATRDVTAILLAEEALETMKSNARFGTAIAIPTTVSRNGSEFKVRTEEGTESVSGISMKRVSVTVTDIEGRETKFFCLVGREVSEVEE